MASRSKKQQLRDYLAERGLTAVSGEVWRDLRARLEPVSESYLRDLLRETGLPFEQPWAGVRQNDFAELERSLLEMLAVYESAVAAGDRESARYCRRQVIAAKDRGRFVVRNMNTPAEKRARKEEMVQWMLVWLENPPVFPDWVKLRKPLLAPAGTNDTMRRVLEPGDP